MTDMLAGVVGWPVLHSLSPRMHSFWLRQYGIRGSYLALPVQRHDLSVSLASLHKAGFKGVNLTLPHKEAAYAVAHTADTSARASQAANLLLFRGTQFEARNTDADGLVLSLRDSLRERPTSNEQAVVLGTGGAARAAVLAGDRLHVARICVLGRTRGRADALVNTMCATVNAGLLAADWDEWQTLAPQANLLVNATSAGLNGTDSPDLSLECLPDIAVVCDLVYQPLETPLLARARARKLLAIDGLGMLMHQGGLAFELLFGVRPTVSADLRADLVRALRNEA